MKVRNEANAKLDELQHEHHAPEAHSEEHDAHGHDTHEADAHHSEGAPPLIIKY